jgi:cytochrome c-type biogenesis protein CcmH/NrfG
VNIALVTILGVALAGLLTQVQWGLSQVSHRLDRIEDRLAALEKEVTRTGQALDDHLTSHPGPTERLVR